MHFTVAGTRRRDSYLAAEARISIQVGGDIDLGKVEPYQGRIVLGSEMFGEILG